MRYTPTMHTYAEARQLVADHFRDEYPPDGPERHYVPPWGWYDPTDALALVPHGCWGEFHDDDPENPWTGPARDSLTAVDLRSGRVYELPGPQDATTRALLDTMPKVGSWPDE